MTITDIYTSVTVLRFTLLHSLMSYNTLPQKVPNGDAACIKDGFRSQKYKRSVYCMTLRLPSALFSGILKNGCSGGRMLLTHKDKTTTHVE